MLEPGRVGDLALELLDRDLVLARVVCAEADVHVVVGEGAAHVGEQGGAVERLDLDRTGAGGLAAESHSTPIRRSGARVDGDRVRAVGAVHRHAAVTGVVADDLVARDRVAAAREVHDDVVEALDVDAARLRRPAAPVDPDGRGLPARRARRSRPRTLATCGDDRLGLHVVLADRGVERGDVGVVHLLGDLLDHRVLEHTASTGMRASRIAAPRTSAPVSTACVRRSRLNQARILLRAFGVVDHLEPVVRRAGPGDVRREDLDRVARDRASVSSGTSRSLTRAPMQRCPISVCTA